MYQILMSNCKRYHLDQLNIDCKITFSLDDCLCDTNHKVFATRCKALLFVRVGTPIKTKFVTAADKFYLH